MTDATPLRSVEETEVLGSSSGREGHGGPRVVTRRSTGTVTLRDVAESAGVSPQTVSRALRSPDEVSEATLVKVTEAVGSTGYVPNLAARNLASNRSHTVAAIVPTLSASVFSDAVDALDEVLTPLGYQLFVGATRYVPEREEELIRAFLGRRPDGLFIVGTTHTAAASHLMRQARIPVVETWNLTEDPVHSVVGFSNTDGTRALMDYLLDRGYKHPTFAGSLSPGNTRAIERRHGFELVLRARLPLEPVRVVSSEVEEGDLDAGVRLLDQVLLRHPETDVIVFSSDAFAAGAVLECVRRGISVPGRLAITGFGDFELARHLVPSLTTVAAPNREIGARAGELLLHSMSAAGTQPETVDLGFSVAARESA